VRRVLRLHAIQYGRVLQVPVARVTVRGWPRGGPQATWGVLLLLVALVAARGWPRGGPQAAWGVLLSSAPVCGVGRGGAGGGLWDRPWLCARSWGMLWGG
jgi:hypothetical protein